MPNNDIFSNKDQLLTIWKSERELTNFSAKLMWENVRTMTTIIAVLVTADIALMNFIFTSNSTYWPLLPFLPSIIIIFSIYSWKDLKNRWRRVLESVAHLIKLESLLGLYGMLPDSEIFHEDKFLFTRWRRNAVKYATSDDFIKGEFGGSEEAGKTQPNMYSFMKRIYLLCILVAIALIVVHFILINQMIIGHDTQTKVSGSNNSDISTNSSKLDPYSLKNTI